MQAVLLHHHLLQQVLRFQLCAGQKLRVSVFAPTQRSTSKKWKQYFESEGVDFRPVAQLGTTDPDEAIKLFAQKLAKKQKVTCLAILTGDAGYADLVRHLKSSGKDVVMFIPCWRSANKASVAYEAEKAKVVLLKPGLEPAPGVQAILEADGAGRVWLVKKGPPESATNEEFSRARAFLNSHDYSVEQDMPVVATIAKFWYQHSIGPLVVFLDFTPCEA